MKKTVLLISLLIAQTATYSNNNQEDTSRLILFLGRFHPLILHLPIGALLITFYIDILGRIKKEYPHNTIKYALGFSAFFAILTCVFGYFLSLEGGYDEKTLDLHFWIGILAAVMTTVLFLIKRMNSKNARLLFFPFFILTIASISVAGHYGSVLTHGEDFITEYAKAPEKEPTITSVDSLKIYENVVLKILDDKCIQCHNSTKKKGELSLISKEMILAGGENGKIIEHNNAHNSTLFTNALLPLHDDLHMPPDGKPQLTKNELWILKYWINNGLDFESKVANLKPNDTLNSLLKKYLVFEKKYISHADQSDINKLIEKNFTVYNAVPNQPELIVKFNGNTIDKGTLKFLLNIKNQIIELDLSNTNLNDNMTGPLKNLANVQKLKIYNTQISDKTLQNITPLENLKLLNIHNTDISLKGLEKLIAKNEIQQIYTWQTKVSNDDSKRLSNNFDITISNGVFDGFVEKTALKEPTTSTKQTLFVDTISVQYKTKIRNATIRYTLDGTEPTENSLLYKEPILLNQNTTVSAKVFKENWYPSPTLVKSYAKISMKVTNYSILEEPDPQYPNSKKLFDLEEGTTNFRDGKWTGFNGNNIETTVDLGETKTISNVSVNCLEKFQDYILFPKKLKVYASNSKESNFKKLGELKIKSEGPGSVGIIKRFNLNFPEETAQYFKIIVENPKVLPVSHPAAGSKSWIFVDEIMIQ